MEVQLGELREGYEKAKSENIKLQDNIETQNKLWKIWLLKFDDKSDDDARKKDKPVESKAKDNGKPLDNEEELLIEDDEVTGAKVDEDESEIIFERFMKNQKKTGFKRTSPSEKPEAVNPRNYNCEVCNFKAIGSSRLKDHMQNAHRSGGKKKETNDEESKENIQFCHFWNNVGSCHFEAKNGRPCIFAHKTAPRCNFDGNCNRKFCMFSHQNQNMAFLANLPGPFRPPIGQRHPRGSPPPWMHQKEGVRRSGWGNRWGNQFQLKFPNKGGSDQRIIE